MEVQQRQGAQLPGADREMVALANRQHLIIARRQLVLIGFSRTAIETRRRRATLIPVHRSVYALGLRRLGARSRWMAAVLACGDGAVLSHRAAGALHNLRGIPAGAVEVTATDDHRIPGIDTRIRRGAVATTVVDAIPVTTIEQTIVDLASTTAPQRLRTYIESAMYRDRIDFAALHALAAARAGRPGIPTLERVLSTLADTAPRAHAGLETRLLELIRAAGLPEPLVNHIVQGVEVDFAWPAARLIVETDGWRWHRNRRAFESDRRRDARLLAAGWRVLRLTHERLRGEADAVIAELAALLRS